LTVAGFIGGLILSQIYASVPPQVGIYPRCGFSGVHIKGKRDRHSGIELFLQIVVFGTQTWRFENYTVYAG